MNLLQKLFHPRGLIVRRTTRTANRQRWGVETERLEPRAYLSSLAHLGVTPPAAEVSIANQKASAPYPNLVGTWNLSGTGTTVLTGTVTVTSAGEDDLNAAINVENLPAINAKVERTNAKVHADITVAGFDEDLHLKGKYNKEHNQLTLKGKLDIPGQGRVKVQLVFTFNSNTNPTTFTLTATSANNGTVSVQGTRVVLI